MFKFESFEKLNAHLAEKPFINGYAITGADGELLVQLMKMNAPDAKLRHVIRWMNNVKSYSIAEL